MLSLEDLWRGRTWAISVWTEELIPSPCHITSPFCFLRVLGAKVAITFSGNAPDGFSQTVILEPPPPAEITTALTLHFDVAANRMGALQKKRSGDQGWRWLLVVSYLQGQEKQLKAGWVGTTPANPSQVADTQELRRKLSVDMYRKEHDLKNCSFTWAIVGLLLFGSDAHRRRNGFWVKNNKVPENGQD